MEFGTIVNGISTLARKSNWEYVLLSTNNISQLTKRVAGGIGVGKKTIFFTGAKWVKYNMFSFIHKCKHIEITIMMCLTIPLQWSVQDEEKDNHQYY